MNHIVPRPDRPSNSRGTGNGLVFVRLLFAAAIFCMGTPFPHLFAGDAIVGTARPSESSAQDDAEKEVRAAIAEMIEQLESDGFQDFARLHMPVEEYLKVHRMGARLPDAPARQALTPLLNWLKGLQEYEIEFDESGLNVRMFPKPGAAPPEPKQPPGPYADLVIAENTDGYGNDLSRAIASALRDLKAEKFDVFMDAMIPPGTAAMMKQDGRWEQLQESLSADSPMILKMIEDLSILQGMNAEIDGDLAEFAIPVTGTVIVNRQETQQDVGTRSIRFSRIGGHWRFFEETAKLREEMAAALQRQPPEAEAEPDQFVLEKIGSDWRLREIPRDVIRGTREAR